MSGYIKTETKPLLMAAQLAGVLRSYPTMLVYGTISLIVGPNRKTTGPLVFQLANGLVVPAAEVALIEPFATPTKNAEWLAQANAAVNERATEDEEMGMYFPPLPTDSLPEFLTTTPTQATETVHKAVAEDVEAAKDSALHPTASLLDFLANDTAPPIDLTIIDPPIKKDAPIDQLLRGLYDTHTTTQENRSTGAKEFTRRGANDTELTACKAGVDRLQELYGVELSADTIFEALLALGQARKGREEDIEKMVWHVDDLVLLYPQYRHFLNVWKFEVAPDIVDFTEAVVLDTARHEQSMVRIMRFSREAALTAGDFDQAPALEEAIRGVETDASGRGVEVDRSDFPEYLALGSGST